MIHVGHFFLQQAPRVELETWGVQQKSDPPPGGFPDQPSLLESDGTEADRSEPPVENQAGPNKPEKAEDEDVLQVHLLHSLTHRTY